MGFAAQPYSSQHSGLLSDDSGEVIKTVSVSRWLSFAVALLLIGCLGCGSAGSRPAEMARIPFGDGPPVLLFVGTGTSATDVKAIKSILQDLKIDYATADSTQLSAMTEVDLMSHRLLIVPGGNSIEIGGSVTANTTAMIRDAVQRNGLHYLGICAGAFFGGASIYNGVNLTAGVGFDFFAHNDLGIHKAAVTLTFSDNTRLDAYWQDGPQLSGWGNVVAKYPDGTPAISEGASGIGFVIFTGVHLEAPADWRDGLNFSTSVSTDVAYAGTVIQAALSGTPLPHF
jgi:glutamine amidotransferase-like uncharacterized protein